MANFDGMWDSEEENCIFSGPVTAKELEVRWRLLMKEKEESSKSQTPVESNNRTMDSDMDDSGICPSDIPLPDDDFVSMEESSCCTEEEIGATGPAPESPQEEEEAGRMESADPSESTNMLEESDKENQSFRTPSQIGFQSRIPVGMIRRLSTEQVPILKPAKLKFDPQGSKGNDKWEMKMKKVAQLKKPDYMISPSKVRLFCKSQSTLSQGCLAKSSVVSKSDETLDFRSPKTPLSRLPLLRTPSKYVDKYHYVRSPVAQYIRNEAVVLETNKIVPLQELRNVNISKEVDN